MTVRTRWLETLGKVGGDWILTLRERECCRDCKDTSCGSLREFKCEGFCLRELLLCLALKSNLFSVQLRILALGFSPLLMLAPKLALGSNGVSGKPLLLNNPASEVLILLLVFQSGFLTLSYFILLNGSEDPQM